MPWVDRTNSVDGGLNRTSVEEVALGGIVGRRSYNGKICTSIRFGYVHSGMQVELPLTSFRFAKKSFNFIVLNRALESINLLNLFRNDIQSMNLAVLRKQNSKR